MKSNGIDNDGIRELKILATPIFAVSCLGAALIAQILDRILS